MTWGLIALASSRRLRRRTQRRGRWWGCNAGTASWRSGTHARRPQLRRRGTLRPRCAATAAPRAWGGPAAARPCPAPMKQAPATPRSRSRTLRPCRRACTQPRGCGRCPGPPHPAAHGSSPSKPAAPSTLDGEHCKRYILAPRAGHDQMLGLSPCWCDNALSYVFEESFEPAHSKNWAMNVHLICGLEGARDGDGLCRCWRRWGPCLTQHREVLLHSVRPWRRLLRCAARLGRWAGRRAPQAWPSCGRHWCKRRECRRWCACRWYRTNHANNFWDITMLNPPGRLYLIGQKHQRLPHNALTLSPERLSW